MAWRGGSWLASRGVVGLMLALVVSLAAAGAVFAAEALKRQELRRTDLTGRPGVEVIMTRLEAAPGAFIPRHTHPGDEFLYVLAGGTVQVPGQPVVTLKSGQTLHFPRGVPHGGFRVVGSQTIKAITMHVVDKGKPLVELVR